MNKGVSIFFAAFTILVFYSVALSAVKNVAVVETEVDLQSGAATELTPAEVRQITGELRRQAVKILPRDKYNVMTSETVQAQGSAILQECADENCVIALGSKIGADYIVHGVISKLLTKFTLSVEIYDTENGNLVASSDPVRSDNIEELLEKTGAVSAEMYKIFANIQSRADIAAQKPNPTSTPSASVNNVASVADGKDDNTYLQDDFTVSKRSATLGLNWLVPGLGSIIIMRDYVGGGVQIVGAATGYALFISGFTGFMETDAGGGSVIMVGCGIGVLGVNFLFNIIRSGTYHRPSRNAATGNADGFNFAVLPDKHGELKIAAMYNAPF